MQSTELPTSFTETFAQYLIQVGLSPLTAWFTSTLILVLCFSAIVALMIWIRRSYLKSLITRITQRTAFTWDDFLEKYGVFTWGANIGIALVFIVLSRMFFGDLAHEGIQLGRIITGLCHLYFIVTLLFFIDSLLNAFVAYYQSLPVARDIEIKGFIQAIKLIILLVGIVFMMSIILGRSPVFFLSGLGALTAVLLLIFKDAILGFVAGIQISVNRTVKVGDWIEMPTHLADGDVIDISLTTVKIQNWDRTITSIPTYDLIARPFKNWRGMQESGGRRIKRSIMVDLNSIRFADPEMIEEYKRISLIREYIERKLEEIDSFNKSNGIEDCLRNGRNITNIGTFRAYCIAYLRAHPKIRQDMILLVRQLDPTPQGLPLEIYVFVNDIAWVNYESVQADIFDHMLSILPVFHLRAFQDLSGRDVSEAILSKALLLEER